MSLYYSTISQIKEAINWHYFQQIPKTTTHLFSSLLKLFSEINYELPFFKTIELLVFDQQPTQEQSVIFSEYNLSSATQNLNFTGNKSVDKIEAKSEQLTSQVKNPIFVYVFHHFNSLSIKGNVNYFSGGL